MGTDMDTVGVSARNGAFSSQGARSRGDLNPIQGGAASSAEGPAGHGPSAENSGAVLSLLDAAARDHHAATFQARSLDTGSGPSVDGQAADLVAQFQQDFAATAHDHDAFHALMRASFGDHYDYSAAEQIRQQSLAGDFSWMPDVQVVEASTLLDQSGTQTSGTALGAFSAETDTIYISRDVLLSDPERAAEILAEEMGHALDVRVNDSDTAGDEGEIFAQLLAGNELSAEELAALRAENDHGTIVVDGREVEVEYGCNPVKAIVDVFTAPFQALTSVFQVVIDVVSDIWEALKDVVVKVLNSSIFQALLTIASFIPIPIVQIVVRVAQIAKAVYAVAQGIKHGSLAMVLGGIAGVAGGAAHLGGWLGASSSFVNTANRIATWAGGASRAYQALAQGDFAAALALGRTAFSGSPVGDALELAHRAQRIGEAVDKGDVLGALQLGSQLIGDLGGDQQAAALNSVGQNVLAVARIVDVAQRGDYDGAAQLLLGRYGEQVGLGTEAQQRIVRIAGAVEMAATARDLINDDNYASAALALFATADHFDIGETARQRLDEAAHLVGRLADLKASVDRRDYRDAASLAVDLIARDPGPQMRHRIERLFDGIDQLESLLASAPGRGVNERRIAVA